MRTRCSGNARAQFTKHPSHSVWGGPAGGVAGSEDEDTESDTDLATVQKGPKYFVLYCHIHIFATILHVSHVLHI